jgi:PIN domain nuclease of toxin-antitoxin system
MCRMIFFSRFPKISFRLLPHKSYENPPGHLHVSDENAALHLIKLPALHNDPFDRMLVYQSIVHGMTILTPDKLLLSYPARTIW